MHTPPRSLQPSRYPMLEGFTKTGIDTYLVVPSLSKQKRAHLVGHIFATLAQGTDCFLFSTHDVDPVNVQEDYLIHGPGRYLVKGHGKTVEDFQEQEERLSFFLKPGFASDASLLLQGQPSQHGISLTRDTTYRYRLESELTFLTKTSEEIVELATHMQTIDLQPTLFWNFVFATKNDRAEISVAHAAMLLGLSTLTLHRRIGEGKLPAVRASSSHPGIRREGLEEYIAYRHAFPQGCISPKQVARYQAWRTSWREQRRYT